MNTTSPFFIGKEREKKEEEEKGAPFATCDPRQLEGSEKKKQENGHPSALNGLSSAALKRRKKRKEFDTGISTSGRGRETGALNPPEEGREEAAPQLYPSAKLREEKRSPLSVSQSRKSRQEKKKGPSRNHVR